MSVMTFQERLKRRMLYSHIKEHEAGLRLVDYLAANYPRWDAAHWRMQILDGNVELNGVKAPPESLLKRHDCVAYFPGDLPEPAADLHFSVVYEDADLLVVNKPGDLCVHPTGAFFRNTLWRLVGEKYGEIRFVNRLDRETSGLLLAARSVEAAAKMNFQSFEVHKEYLALVFGRFSGTVRACGRLVPDSASSIPKKKRLLPESACESDGEFADTELSTVRPVAPDMTLVRAVPFTGRQHQIRATLFSLGFPLVGDKLYGPDERIYPKIRTCSITPDDYALLRMPRQALHSSVLTFRHPRTNERIRCEAPLPPDFLR